MHLDLIKPVDDCYVPHKQYSLSKLERGAIKATPATVTGITTTHSFNYIFWFYRLDRNRPPRVRIGVYVCGGRKREGLGGEGVESDLVTV